MATPWIRPLRRSTFVRDLVLLALHLLIYGVFIGSVLNLAAFVGFRYRDFDTLFWPAFAWGTLVAAQAGTVFLQRRRVLGAILGAIASVLLGSWILGHIYEYRGIVVVLRTVAASLAVAAVAVSLFRRPPALILAGRSLAPIDPAQVFPASVARRSPSLVSIPNLLLGMFAVVFILSAIVAGTFRALEVQGSGERGGFSTDLAPFTGVNATGQGTLILIPGTEPSLSVEGDANLLGFVQVEVVNGELALTFDPGPQGPVQLTQPLVYTVTLPSLENLSIGDEIEASIDLPVERESLRLVVGGDARLSAFDLAVGSLSVASRDAGRVALSGRVDAATIEASGTSVVDALDLTIGDADATISDRTVVDIGDVATLGYRQSGSATLQCGDVAAIRPGSIAAVPQCVASRTRVPAGGSDGSSVP